MSVLRQRAMTLVGALISVAALVWLARSHDWRDLVQSFRDADWRWLALVPLLMLPNFALRAQRWRILFPEQRLPGFSGAFAALMAGYLFNNVLPARAGELVRVHLIGRREQLPRSTALGTVVLERTLDLLVLLALLAAVLPTQPLPAWAGAASKVVAAAALVALAAVIAMALLGQPALRFVVSSAVYARLPQAAGARLAQAGSSFIEGVSSALRTRHLGRFIGLTALVWLLELLLVAVLARGFGVQIGALGLLFVMLIIALGTMVPSSPGYLGTFELFGITALGLLGVAGGGALGFVVAYHATVLFGASLIGALTLAWYGWPRLDQALGRPARAAPAPGAQ